MSLSVGTKAAMGVLSIVSTPVATVVAGLAVVILKIKAAVLESLKNKYVGNFQQSSADADLNKVQNYSNRLHKTNSEIVQWAKASIPFIGVYLALGSHLTRHQHRDFVDYTDSNQF